MKYRILLLEEIAPAAAEFLGAQEDCEVIHNDDSYDPSTVDAIIVRGKLGVDPEMMDKMPRVKVISRCGVGVDNVNVAFATSKNILVTNTPGVNADTVAEHTIGLMLMLQRKLYKSVTEVKTENWAYRVDYDGDEIRDKTLGILGMGSIGMKVASLASCFGMKVQYSSRNRKQVSYSYVTMDDLLSSSDIISIHLPLSEQTKHTIDSDAIRKLKKGTILINTARGPIVDERALVHGLEQGKVGGYGGDFPRFDAPENKNVLLHFENVLITPHSSSLTNRTFEALCLKAVHNTLAFLRGNTVDEKNRVNVIS